jgi:hypothetical protein
MKTGRSLQDISQQILAETKTKKDYIVNTPVLTVTPTEDQKDIQLGFSVRGEARQYKPTNHCLEQISDRVGIPRKYADRMRREAPALLATNINHWFQNVPEKRMVRTFNNSVNVARAFLSNGYRPFDNYDLAQTVIPKLQAAGCEIRSCEITESRFYLQASTPRIQALIDQTVRVGTHERIQRTVQAGVIIGNSEVGVGSVFVDPMMYDLVCTNGLILERTLKRHHVGRRNEGELLGDENSFELFSDETRKLDDKAFWAKVSDVVMASLDEIKFNQNINRLRETQGQMLAVKPADMKEVVEVTAGRFNFSDTEKDSLLAHFAAGGDFSKYGLINAITRTAEDVDSYDRAVELERLGGQVIELPPWDFIKN